jgi:polysaccharide biosynthesis transport protein
MSALESRPARAGGIYRILRRKGWLVVLCAFVGAAASFAAAKHSPKRYSASASLLFQASQLDERLFGTSYTPAYVDPATQAQTNLGLVTLPVVASTAASDLGHTSARAVGASVSAAAAGNSSIVNVTAVAGTPSYASRVANAYVRAFVDYRRAAEQRQADGAAQLLSEQLRAVEAQQPTSSQVKLLTQRITQLHVLASLQTGDVSVAQTASPPTAPSSPTTKKDVALGLIAGTLVGLLFAFASLRFNRKLLDQEEVQETYRLPVIGAIPQSRSFNRSEGGSVIAPGEREVFRLLHARLRYFNVDRNLRTILVTSATPADGKTTIAWHLARTAAEISPESSVLLLEADLRRPTIGRLAGLGPSVGLSEILSNNARLADAVREVEVGTATNGRAPTLHVLTAGTPPPNPTELIESESMQRLLADVHNEYDLVIVDAPPASIVSDTIPLMSLVDGILIVARLGNTNRASARLLRAALDELDAPALGLVVNGLKSRASGYYGADPGLYQARERAV